MGVLSFLLASSGFCEKKGGKKKNYEGVDVSLRIIIKLAFVFLLFALGPKEIVKQAIEIQTLKTNTRCKFHNHCRRSFKLITYKLQTVNYLCKTQRKYALVYIHCKIF